MPNFKNIIAGLCIAGITVFFANFMSGQIVLPKDIVQNAITIDTNASGGSIAKKKKGAQPILALIASADIARGKKLSKKCAACHSFNQGGANKVGPNQWNLVGRDKASTAGFSYSAAMASKGGSWTYEDLNKFIWKPKSFVKGTKLSYGGLKKADDRAALIAWMRTLSSSPQALPSAKRIAAEQAELGM